MLTNIVCPIYFCRRKKASKGGFYSADNAGHETADEGSDIDTETEGELAVQHAWGELAEIERAQEKWSEARTNIEQKLEACRQRGVELEDVNILHIIFIYLTDFVL